MNVWRTKLSIYVDEFQRRIISDDVFRACLYSAGFRGVRLEEEFRYQLGIRHDIEKLQTLDRRLQHL